MDISKLTFEHLDELLAEVCDGMDGQSDWPPPQEKECMAVAGLNLLNLQVSGMNLFVNFEGKQLLLILHVVKLYSR